MLTLGLLSIASLASPITAATPGDLVSVRDTPSLWAQRAAAVGDVTGDGVDEIACTGATQRRSNSLKLDLAPDWIVHNGADGAEVGRIQGLPFTSRSCTSPSLVQVGGRTWFALFGIIASATPAVGVALVSTDTLCIESVRQYSEPLASSDDIALAKLGVRQAVNSHGDSVGALLLMSDASGCSHATLFRIDSEGAAVWTTLWKGRSSDNIRPMSVAAVTDVDGDNERDFVVGWVPKHAVDLPEDLEEEPAGQLEFLCGRSGRLLRTVAAPAGSGFYGRAVAVCPSERELLVGAPGAVWSVNHKEVIRSGAVHVYSLPSLALVRSIAPARVELQRHSSGVAAVDRFAEAMLVVQCTDRRIAVVGDPAASLSGEVQGFDVDTGALMWRAQSGPDGRFDMESDFEFGARLSRCTMPRVLVNARRPNNEGGRLLLLDGCSGSELGLAVKH